MGEFDHLNLPVKEGEFVEVLRLLQKYPFVRFITAGAKDECWLWHGEQSSAGYGRYRGESAHRLMFSAARGLSMDDLQGVVVRHRCDNPPCCNPWHLEPGTHADNMRDKMERGRAKLGHNSAMAKLTPEQVIEIRMRRREGVRKLAREFGIGHNTAFCILNNLTWKEEQYHPKEIQENMGQALRRVGQVPKVYKKLLEET